MFLFATSFTSFAKHDFKFRKECSSIDTHSNKKRKINAVRAVIYFYFYVLNRTVNLQKQKFILVQVPHGCSLNDWKSWGFGPRKSKHLNLCMSTGAHWPLLCSLQCWKLRNIYQLRYTGHCTPPVYNKYHCKRDWDKLYGIECLCNSFL